MNNKGLVTVAWTKSMRVPRNLTAVSNGTCKYSDAEAGVMTAESNLNVIVIPGNKGTKNDLSFTWNFTSWDNQQGMILQIYFNSPEEVSTGTTQDRL